jgi:hypothetical protein
MTAVSEVGDPHQLQEALDGGTVAGRELAPEVCQLGALCVSEPRQPTLLGILLPSPRKPVPAR